MAGRPARPKWRIGRGWPQLRAAVVHDLARKEASGVPASWPTSKPARVSPLTGLPLVGRGRLRQRGDARRRRRPLARLGARLLAGAGGPSRDEPAAPLQALTELACSLAASMLWGENGPPTGFLFIASSRLPRQPRRRSQTTTCASDTRTYRCCARLRHAAAAARARPSHPYVPHRTPAHPSHPPRLRRLTQTNHG